ncbi:MAG: RNA polymerase sigma factor, partial [Bacteroidia bacterium]|nr:RNA polymerase sigma factor [Bacteroidia bacterium]
TFGSWLKRIVINKSIVQYRKSQRFVEVPDFLASQEVDDDMYDSGISSDNYESVQSSQLLDSMNSLHENYRNILSLHFIEGYDYEEICEILNISYANCRTLMSRAKESLRKKLISTAV